MSFEEVRRKQPIPKQESVFRELFQDYKKWQCKRVHLSKTQQAQKNCLTSNKAMHAMRMTQIIQKHSEDTAREGVSMFNTTMLAASDKKMLSCTFKNQSREELSRNVKRGYFRDIFTKKNPFITSLKREIIIQEELPDLKAFGNIHQNTKAIRLEKSVDRLNEMNNLKVDLDKYQQLKKQKLRRLKKMRIYKYEYPYLNDQNKEPSGFSIKRVYSSSRLMTSTKQNIFPGSDNP